MTGLDIIIPSDVDNTSLPYADDRDQALAPGVLALVAPAHSAIPMAAGLASQQTVPNIARDHARVVLGNDSAEVDFKLVIGDGRTSQSSRFARTSKGAIEGVMSRVNNTAQYQGANIQPVSSVLTDYIASHPNHAFYISMLIRLTRPAVAGSQFPMISQIANLSDPFDTLYRALPTYTPGQGVYSGGSVERLGYDADPAITGTPGVGLLTMELRNWSPANPQIAITPAVWGELQTFLDLDAGNSAQVRGKSASFILYRWMLEDLTVSGRTYSEVSSLDRKIARREFAPGGLYYGDTFTDPASLP